MSEIQQLKKMRLNILGNSSDSTKDEIFKDVLTDAEVVALNALYPYNDEIIELPNTFRLKNWQTRCAIELYKAMERIGVQSYSENGLSVSYLTGLISNSLMNELIPKAGVPK